MNDQITDFIKYHPVKTQRGLEILTGLIPWSIILFPFVGSFFIPDLVAYFVIAFNVYWLYRSLQMAIFATSGYLNIRATKKINWLEKLTSDPVTQKTYQNIFQVILIPNVNEPLPIIERQLESLASQSFPKENIVVVLAMEARVENAQDRAQILIEKYQKKFGKIVATFHSLASGETIGKHSNEAYAAREIKKILVDQEKTPIEDVVITTSDADSVYPKDYFSLLTYKFLLSQNRYNNFFQAPLFMYNNIHRVPLFVRVPSIMGGIYFLAILQKMSKRFVNFSTYSLSLKLLDEVGYWDIDVIPEDAHLFFKTYFAKHGQISVVPIFLPISIDAAESGTQWETFKNSYQQNKRWAWGAVDIPYVVKNFLLHPEIPLWDKFVKLSLAIEWHFVWSSYWFLITLGATIPTIINPVFARTTLGLNLSRISGLILTVCLVGLLTVIVIDILLNPNYKNKLRTFLHPLTYLQWLTLPIVGLIFGSLPGLESQTRLMLGKYIKYHVTEKKM